MKLYRATFEDGSIARVYADNEQEARLKAEEEDAWSRTATGAFEEWVSY